MFEYFRRVARAQKVAGKRPNTKNLVQSRDFRWTAHTGAVQYFRLMIGLEADITVLFEGRTPRVPRMGARA
jgi:hypothetical protein